MNKFHLNGGILFDVTLSHQVHLHFIPDIERENSLFRQCFRSTGYVVDN